MVNEYEDFNPIMWADAYSLSHFFLKKNVDWEISLLFNRNRPMILNGFSKIVNSIVKKPITYEMIMDARQKAKDMGKPFQLKM